MEERPVLPQVEALLGEVVGGVHLHTCISASERSLVFRGEQQPIGREVVMKFLPAMSEESDIRAIQLREVKVLSQIRHPNVVTLYNVGLFEDTYPYFITEFLLGGDLRVAMDQETPFSPSRALGILAQIASAIEEIHQGGMVHRKVSPDNLLLEELVGSKHELVKLSGFSLTSLGSSQRSRFAPIEELAYPQYASPEQVRGEELTPAADLYACGVLLYEMLTGQLPYKHTDPPRLWDEIAHRTPPPLASLVSSLAMQAPLQHIINKLLSKQPTSRLSNARKLRLLTIRLREDMLALTPGTAERSNDQFPVLVTAARLKALPREDEDGESDESFDGYLGEDGFLDDEIDYAPLDDVALDYPDVATLTLDVTALNDARWRTLVDKRAERATGGAYLVLAARTVKGGKLASSFADGAEIIMVTTLDIGVRLVAVMPPLRPERWLKRLAQRARLDQIAIGFAAGDAFGGVGSSPDLEVQIMATQACLASQVGELGSTVATTAAIELEHLFADVDGDEDLVRFVG